MHLGLHIFSLLLCFVSGSSLGKSKILKWPSTFSLEATRTSVTSGIVENYKFWITNNKTRTDYNDGAVKTIVRGDEKEYGVEYQIRPETDEDGDVIYKCYYKEGDLYDSIAPVNILPDPEELEYENVGHEKVNDKTASKFVAKLVDMKSDTTHTVWASFDRKLKAWIPVRYEVQKFSVWVGGLAKYEIWDYSNIDTLKKHVKKDVFELYENYECEEASPYDDFMLKELVFINPDNEKHVDHVFKKYKKEYDRKYAHKKEEALRRTIFQNNMKLIKETNRKNLGYKLSINHFADRTPEEMKRHKGLLRRPEGKVGTVPFPYTKAKVSELENEVPNEYDARMYGLVSTVKNQEDCGSCWTFGTTAAAEGALAKSNGGKLITLANQALIDCVWPYGASGCSGGTDNAAYEWMQDYGLPTEAEYGSYANRDGVCHIQNMTVTYPIKGYTDVTPNSIGALKVALVNHGPLSVSVDVVDSFKFYSGGVYYDNSCNPRSLNHEVTLVGYGEKDGETFWIIRNSWGPQWGIDGYMHISSRDNACGITTEPTYVVF